MQIFSGGTKEPCKKAEGVQLANPLAIQNVRLASRHALQLARFDQLDFEAPRLKHLKHRNPVHARRLHGDRLDTALPEPISQRLQIRRGRFQSNARSPRRVLREPPRSAPSPRCRYRRHSNSPCSTIRAAWKPAPGDPVGLSPPAYAWKVDAPRQIPLSKEPWLEISGRRARGLESANLPNGVNARRRATNFIPKHPRDQAEERAKGTK